MVQHFYDAQIKRYLTQFIRLMSNFSYQDSKGNIVRVPARYGDMNRQVAQIMKKNSENVVASAPFIACYIKSIDFARDRVQSPTHVSKLNIRERAFDEINNEYLNTQGGGYTVERIMPTPFNITFTADIWTTNVDQKLQLFEQIAVLFNPAMEIQTSDNFLDWTSLSTVELKDVNFSSRQIPQGTEQDIDILTMNFITPVWINPPAKVKKLGIITKIISSIFDESGQGIGNIKDLINDARIVYVPSNPPIGQVTTTLKNLNVLILSNTARLIPPEGLRTQLDANNEIPQSESLDIIWNNILDFYPNRFVADVSQIRVTKSNGMELVGTLSLDPIDEGLMHINWDTETFPESWTSVNAIIKPETFDPRILNNLNEKDFPLEGTRYLLLESLNKSNPVDGPDAWKNRNGTDPVANENDIIEWDGDRWNVVFDSATTPPEVYITNITTGIQYVWKDNEWLKSVDGVYGPKDWRLVL